jgi:hypothetical protein
MKLPRWLVIAMLATSATSVLVAGGFWWVTWPERTAREFVQLVLDREFERIRPIIRETSQDDAHHSVQILFELNCIPAKWTQYELRLKNRSWSELLRSRQEFSIVNHEFEFLGKSRESSYYSFTVERGMIVQEGINGNYNILRLGEPESYWLD